MEVLVAIAILGIGIISIASLFPAGIAQQRRAVDDMMGPVVADNAMTILRGKISPEDFGTDEDFNLLTPARLLTLQGDWEWRRPAFFTQSAIIPTPFGDSAVSPGSISIFRTYSETTGTDIPPIPWNLTQYDNTNADAPERIITQQERFYPLSSGLERPQFVWDCMFRRFQGRILVAIFVYRVTSPGGGGVPYQVAANISSPGIPPLPIKITFSNALAWDAEMGSNVFAEPFNIIPNTAAGAAYNPANDAESWQLPGQLILDQNNIIHQVLVGRETSSDGPLELARAVAPVLGNPFDTVQGNLITESPFYYFGDPGENHPVSGITMPGMVQRKVVTRIWYLPEHMNITVNGLTTTYTITPVYVTVREL